MTERSLDDLIDEVVIGLASEEDCAMIEDLAARDAEIAAKLERVRARFLELDDTADELDVPDAMWDRIATDIAAEPDAAPVSKASAEIVAMAPATHAVNRWRIAALSGMAATIFFAAMLGWTVTSRVEPTVIAVLLDDRGQPVALIEGTPDNTTLVTLLESTRIPDNQVMQVWTKPDADGPPVSLGLLPSERSRTLTVEGLPPPGVDQLYEITFEPSGGSPTNLPTGPIHGKGFAKAPVF